MHTPPFISKNLPIIGHTLEFAKDHVKLMQRGYQEKGSIYSISLAGKNAVILIGPEYHKAYFDATDKQLNIEKAYAFVAPFTGEVAFIASHKAYLNQRPILYEPFKYRKFLKYPPIMQRVMEECVAKLPDEGELDLVSYCVFLTRKIAGHAFLGDKFQEEMGTDFWALYDDLSASIDLVLPPNLPLPKFIKRDKARAKMKEMLKPVIAARKARPENYQDFMQEFIETPLTDGTFVDNDTVLNLIVSFMFASHDTTSAQVSWTIIQLLQNPDYLKEMQAELTAKFPYGTVLDLANVAALERVNWAVEESSRMYPSADVLMRFVVEDWEVGGYTIPQGWLAFVAGRVSHFLPEIHENPDKYDPYRFSSDRQEDKTCPYQDMGFGGGTHRCAGMSFAKNEMAVIVAHLFREFELELLTPNPVVTRKKGIPRPSDTKVRFKRKAKHLQTATQQESNAKKGCPYSHDAQI